VRYATGLVQPLSHRMLVGCAAVHAGAGAAFVATDVAFLLGLSAIALIIPCARIAWTRPR